MSQNAMQFTDDQFEKIGKYVRFHFHQWLQEDKKVNGDAVTLQLNQIESSLEASIVLSRERFEMMDQRFDEQKELNREHFTLIEKRFGLMNLRFDEQMLLIRERFESVDKRFESVDKRFESTERRFDEQMLLIRERFESVDKRFESTEKHFDEHMAVIRESDKKQFLYLKERMNRQFTVIMMIAGVLLSAVGAVFYQGFFG